MSFSRLTRQEQATQLYIRDKVVRPLGKRNNITEPEFRGGNKTIQETQERAVIISGAARTGKSFAIIYRLHQIALKYPGVRILFIRKTRESMNESVLVTYEQDVLGVDNPIIPKGQRNARHSYKYPNGSEIIVAGLQASGKDQKARIMSTSFDFIYVQECVELLESEWGQLTTRLSSFRAPWQGIFGDCNPDAPSHWVYRYHLGQKIQFLTTGLQDNPRWWKIDPSKDEGGYWTKEGQSVVDTLGSLTGLQRERLFEGKWVQATGLVYGDVWDDGGVDGNVTELAEYQPVIERRPDGTEVDAADVFIGVDDGYAGEIDEHTGEFTPESHPRVFLLAQMRQDGTICIFDENYKIKTLPERHIQEVEEMGYGEGENFRRYAEPFRVVVDKSAVDLIGRLKEKYNTTQQTVINVEEGVKILFSYIAKDNNGKRKFLVHPRCKHFRYQMANYKRDDKGNIIKASDDGCDVARYIAGTFGSYSRPNFRVLG